MTTLQMPSAPREAAPGLPVARAVPDAGSRLGAADLREHFVAVRSPLLWTLAQRTAALCALVGLLPLFALLFVATRCSSRGPFLFRQRRRGLMGEIFTMYKIRTMSPGREKATALGVAASEPAVTRLGRALRYLKLDELPQLWNVVKGDMEIVGPRPLPLPLEATIQSFLPQFLMRHTVRPGLMNPAQFVQSDIVPEEQLHHEWKTRHRQELECIRCKSLVYDLRVIVAAVFYIGARFLGVARLLNQASPAFGGPQLVPAEGDSPPFEAPLEPKSSTRND